MKKSEQTKQFITEKISPIFNKKGYLGTSLTDLTNATGLTKGALYSHFDCKETMASAALEYNIKILLASLEAYIGQSKSSKGKLLAYLDFYSQYYPIMINNGGCAFMNAAIDSDDTDLKLFNKIRTHFATWRNILITLINEGKQNNEFQPEINEIQFADMFIAMIEGGILLSKTLDNIVSLQNNIQFLRNQIAIISI